MELPFSYHFAIIYSFIPLTVEYLRAGYVGVKGEGDSQGRRICKYIGYKMKIFINGYRKKIIVLSIFDRQNT